ncbi:putative ribonuclease H-like domain-containing protein, partial [Tanacetum coccineum]
VLDLEKEMDAQTILMLVEKKYPLIKELLEKMLNLQLEAEEESTMAFELIKFIKSMLEEWGGLLGILSYYCQYYFTTAGSRLILLLKIEEYKLSRLFLPPNLDLSYSGLKEFQQPRMPMVEELVSNDKLEKKTVSPTVAKISFVRPQQQEKPVRKPANCNYHQRERVVSGNNYTRVNYNYSAKKAHPSTHRNIVPREVLMKTGLRPLNTARPINTAHSKTTVYSARLMSFNTAKGKVNTARPKAVNTTRPNTVVVNAVRANQGHPQKEDQGYVDSGCSRHMTGNMSYLSDFKEFDGGYVTFGGGAKGGRITGKGTLKTGKLDFEDLADESQVLLKVPRKNNMYNVDMKNIVPKESLTCLVAKATLDESMLWHRRLGHVNFKTINKLVKDNLVKGLPIKHFENDQTCVACLKGNNTKPPIENLVDKKVKIIRCDNGTKFKNRVMSEFCEKKGIKREFSVARTPQQNGVAKRKNRTLIEAARTMLADSKLPTTFWAKAIRNTFSKLHETIWCPCTIQTLDHLGKFYGKSDDGFFVGYSLNSKDFRVYNIRTRKVEENLHVRFLEDKPIIAGDGPKWLFDIDVLTKSMNYVPVVAGTNSNDFVGTKESIGVGYSSKETGSRQDYILMPLWKDGSPFDSSSKDASNDEPQPSNDAGKKDDVGGIDDQERTEHSAQDINTARPSINTTSTNFNTFSLIVPTAPLESTYANLFGDESKLDLSNIATTYPVPTTPNIRIHKDHSLDHEESKKVIQAVKDPSWIEAMQEELLQFKLQQVWTLVDLPYGKRAIGTNYKVENALYGQHQAPRAEIKDDILLVQVYVDDIIFGSTKTVLCTEFEKLMHKKFQMSSMGELTFFLRLQVTQKDDGIFISQDKYVDKILNKFSFSTMKTTSTPMETSKPLLKDTEAEDVDVHLYRSMIGSLMYLTASRPDIMFAVCACARFQVTPKVSHLHAMKRIFRYLKCQPKLGLWYPKDSPFYLEAYPDSDYAGASLDRKSTTGDLKEKKLIQMIKIHTDHNVADLLTKAFDVGRFQYLIASIGMLNP